MSRIFIYIIITSVMLFACAASPQPKFEFQAGTRIGIVNHLEPYATHRNFSSLRFDSFTKQVGVNWDIAAYASNRLINDLANDSRYIVIEIGAADSKGGMNREPQLSNRSIGAAAVREETANDFKTLGEKYRLDVIISIRSYAGPSAVKIDDHPIELQGYGLFTRQLLMSKHAYAYANIAVEVFKTEPLTFIGSGVAQNRKTPLDNLDLDGSLKSMPRSEIEKLEPLIKEYADQAVESAVANANLLPPGQ